MLSFLNVRTLIATAAARRLRLCSRTAAVAAHGTSVLLLISILARFGCQSSNDQLMQAPPRAALACAAEYEKSVLLRKKWESFDAQSESTPVPADKDGRVVAIRQRYDVREKAAVDDSNTTVNVAPSELHVTSGDHARPRFRAATQGDLTKFKLHKVGKQAWEEWSACIERTCAASTTVLRKAKRAYELYQSEATARELAAAETELEACRQ